MGNYTNLRTGHKWFRGRIFLTWHEQERIPVRKFMSQKLTRICGHISRTYVLDKPDIHRSLFWGTGHIDIARLEGSKIVEHWGQMDTYGLQQQLGTSGV